MQKRCVHDVKMLCRKLFENQRLRCKAIFSLYSDLTPLKHPPSLPNSPQQQYGIRTFATKSIAETNDGPTSSIIQGTIPFHGKGLKMGQEWLDQSDNVKDLLTRVLH